MTPKEYLEAAREIALLDVRAPVEFAKGHLPGSWNAPILNDNERHLVGIRYKAEGQDAAIALAYELVGPHREERVARWAEGLRREKIPVLTCFRGGLRSRTAQDWLKAAGVSVDRLSGGYKSLRQELLGEIAKPRSGFVLAGFTGSGKTRFLRSLKHPNALDLEGMAGHRGSAFGGIDLPEQPAQQTFENALGLALYHTARGAILLESESRLVGRCVVPDSFFDQMRAFPRVVLEATMEERITLLFHEYVRAPLAKTESDTHFRRLDAALQTIRARLGGLKHQEIRALLAKAFQSGDEGAHREWIRRLLVDYYDPLYEHSIARSQGEVVFRGKAEACREWLREKLAE